MFKKRVSSYVGPMPIAIHGTISFYQAHAILSFRGFTHRAARIIRCVPSPHMLRHISDRLFSPTCEGGHDSGRRCHHVKALAPARTSARPDAVWKNF